MRQSMTGFATQSGTLPSLEWVWDARSVNGRGLDLRFRLPEGLEVLESKLRPAIAARFKRGNISISLRIATGDAPSLPQINPAALDAALAQVREVGDRATALHVDLVAPTAVAILSLRGVSEMPRGPAVGQEAVQAAVAESIEGLLDALLAARASEGESLLRILTVLLDQMAELATQAREMAEKRAREAGPILRQRVSDLLAATTAIDEARLAQELALLAVKADVREELDRLDAHIEAGRALLAAPDPAGRKLDFLTQEFLREVNTLCSKSNHQALTSVGLDLKAVIEQLREQVQNLE